MSAYASTTSLEPHQTQNSALVIEHRCLYTHDLRRKAKRWQDGFLRFHTFNKRVMIYDVPRNYIGDTHWREQIPVQDGDEFELDRPILVQVGEKSGSAEQDLTGLLEKRHKKDYKVDNRVDSHYSSPQTTRTENGPRMGSAYRTQLRPKSLNALLGTPKGPLGKASLPIKSPYQIRSAAEDIVQNIEPPVKRRCVGVLANRAQSPINKTCRPGRATKVQPRKKSVENSVGDHLSSIHENPLGDEPSIAAVNHGTKTKKAALKRDEGSQLDGLESTSRREGDCDNEEGSKAVQRIEMDSKARHKPTKSRKQNIQSLPLNTQGAPETKIQPQSSTRSVITETSSDSGTNTNHSNDQSIARPRLRIIAHKPRRKLMYKDLLPQEMPLVDEHLSSNNESNLVRSESRYGITLSNELLSQWHHDEQDHLEARLRQFDAKVESRNKERVLSPEQIVGNSDWPPNGRGDATSPSKRGGELEQGKSTIRGSRSLPLEVTEPITSEAKSTIHSTNLALATMDEILLSRCRPDGSDRLADLQDCNDSSSIEQPSLPSLDSKLNSTNLRSRNPARSVPKVQKMQAPPCQLTSQILSTQGCDVQDASLPIIQKSDATKEDMEPPKTFLIPASPNQAPWNSSGHVESTQLSVLPLVVSQENQSSDAIAPHKTLPAAATSTTQRSLKSSNPLEVSSTTPSATHSLDLLALPSLETQAALLESTRLQSTLGRVSSNDPQTFKAATSLPPFKPLHPARAKQRSPLKKAVSDTSAAIEARKIADLGQCSTKARDANCAQEQLASPWSKEAWDLFGCGRDGKIVGFRDFCVNERV